MPQYIQLLLECPLVIAAIFVCGIGGTFQYGYCVSAMTSPSEFIKELVNKTCLQRYNISLEQWQASLIWSFMVSIFSIGGLVGSLLAGPLLTKLARKQCFLLNNFVAIFGAVLMILSQTAMSFEMIMVGRFLYGINAGLGMIVHTMFLVECAPKRLRGMVGVTIATFSSFGKFSGQLLGISELLGTQEAWPWLLGFNGFPAILQLFTLPFLPESPRFLLLERGDHKACENALRRLWGNKDHSKEVEEMLEEKAALQSIRSHSVMELIRSSTVRWQVLTIVITFTAVQLCGINSVYFYSTEVFRAAGIPEHHLSYAALGTGLCELFTSVTCFMIIENMGKKVLLLRGYTGMSATLILLTITLYLQTLVSWMPYVSMILVFFFIFSFASGPAGVTAPLPGELFTQSSKSAAYTLACTISWVGLFVVGILFPILVENLHYFCFLIFLFFCVGTVLFVKFNVPETKNRTALEIAKEFEKMHCKCEESQRKRNNENLNGIIIYDTKF